VIEVAIAEDAVKALALFVLPRTPRVNKVGIDTRLAQPSRDLLYNTCRAVIPFDPRSMNLTELIDFVR
jgi:hypothetical protein